MRMIALWEVVYVVCMVVCYVGASVLSDKMSQSKEKMLVLRNAKIIFAGVIAYSCAFRTQGATS